MQDHLFVYMTVVHYKITNIVKKIDEKYFYLVISAGLGTDSAAFIGSTSRLDADIPSPHPFFWVRKKLSSQLQGELRHLEPPLGNTHVNLLKPSGAFLRCATDRGKLSNEPPQRCGVRSSHWSSHPRS